MRLPPGNINLGLCAELLPAVAVGDAPAYIADLPKRDTKLPLTVMDQLSRSLKVEFTEVSDFINSF